MPSQLLTNDKIKFVVAKPFSSRGKDYEIGDDFPQEDADRIETFVRARFVIPVVEDIEDKKFIRHWHREIRPRDEVIERLTRDRVQLQMPEPEGEVDLEVLTHPETTPEPEATEQAAAPESESDASEDEGSEFNPSEHTVNEVLTYIAEHPEDRDRVLAAEEADRGRKGILEA